MSPEWMNDVAWDILTGVEGGLARKDGKERVSLRVETPFLPNNRRDPIVFGKCARIQSSIAS
jgi:hypothetical protein